MRLHAFPNSVKIVCKSSCKQSIKTPQSTVKKLWKLPILNNALHKEKISQMRRLFEEWATKHCVMSFTHLKPKSSLIPQFKYCIRTRSDADNPTHHTKRQKLSIRIGTVFKNRNRGNDLGTRKSQLVTWTKHPLKWRPLGTFLLQQMPGGDHPKSTRLGTGI